MLLKQQKNHCFETRARSKLFYRHFLKWHDYIVLVTGVALFITVNCGTTRPLLVVPQQSTATLTMLWHNLLKVVVFLSCAVMAGLYSRVVYMLWFKRNDDNGLEHRQKVNIKLRIHAPGEEFFCLFSLGFFFMSGTTNQNKGTDFVQMLCLPSPTCRSVFVLMRE